MGEEAIKSVIRNNSNKTVSWFINWYIFLIFELFSGHIQLVPYFLAREEQTLSWKIVENVVLIEAFIEHYPELLRQHKSDVGNSLNASSMSLRVGIVCNIWVML